MAEHFAQQFVDEHDVGLGAQRVANLGLHHGEREPGEGPGVVVTQKALTVQAIVVLLPVPQSHAGVHLITRGGADLKRDVVAP